MKINSSKNKILILSAQLGKSDFKLPDFKIFENCDYYFITDQKKRHDIWNFLKPIEFTLDKRYKNRRNYKINKILPFLIFKDYEYILWHDCTSYVKTNPNAIISNYLSNSDFGVFKHPTRNCIYEELKILSTEPLDHIESLNNYKLFLDQINYKKKSGLFETTAFIVRINNKTIAMMLSWWELICRFSSRDQLSLPIALSYHNINPSILPGSGQNYGGNNKLIPSLSKSFRENQIL